MALQRQIISMNLGSGVDNTSDIKVGPDNQFNVLQDFIYPKMKRIDKRYGTRKVGTSVLNDDARPISIGSTTKASDVFAHSDELLMQNKGRLYSYVEDLDKVTIKGNFDPCVVDVKPIMSNQYSLVTPAMGINGNLSIYVYSGFDYISNLRFLNYSVKDNTSDTYLIADAQIGTGTSLLSTFDAQVITFPVAGKAFIVYLEQGGLGVQMKIRDVLSGGLVSSATVLANKGSISELKFCYTNKAGVGERVFISYSGNTPEIFAINSTGAVDGSIPGYSIAGIAGANIFWNSSSEKLYFAYLDTGSGDFDILVKVLSFTSSTLTLSTTITAMTLGTVTGDTRLFTHICFAQDPDVLSNTWVFIEEVITSIFSGKNVPDDIIYKSKISASAVVEAYSRVGRTLTIIGEPVTDLERKTVYIPCAYGNVNTDASVIQQTGFLIDVLKGKSETDFQVTAMFNDGLLNYIGLPLMPKVSVVSGKLIFPVSVRNRIISAQDASILYQGAIQEVSIDLLPNESASKSYLSNTTLLSGGFLGAYDGARFCENNFFLYPEFISLGATKLQNIGVLNVTSAINATLDTSDAANTGLELNLCNGNQLAGAVGVYFDFTIGALTNQKIAFSVDNGAYIPVHNVLVYITSTMTASEILSETMAALKSVYPGSFLYSTKNDASTLMLKSVSNTTTVSGKGYHQVTDGTIPSGNYSYTALFSYTDKNGNIIRSATTAQKSVTVDSEGDKKGKLSVCLHTPPVTLRNIDKVKVEIYRTTNNGTEFYKINSFLYDPSFSSTSTRLQFNDTILDDNLIKNQPIYTAGGVLDNAQIQACKNLSFFKNRVVVAGTSGNEIYYSKTSVVGAPIEFAKELYATVDNDGSPITGHAQMDDKLIIFKKNKIIALSGDGANDLGSQVSFSQPFNVTSDVGCVSHNSIVLIPHGLMFKSEKGIYLLDRKLQTSYVGAYVKDFNSFAISRAVLSTSDQKLTQARFYLKDTDKCLVFDYDTGRWSVFTKYGADDACIWKGINVRIDSSGALFREDSTIFKDIGSAVESYSSMFETQWMQLKDVQDYQRVYRLGFLGSLKSAHALNVKIWYDYDETNYDEYNFDSSSISGSAYNDSVYQPLIHLKRQKCESMKIRMTAIPSGGTEECLNITDMSFEAGMKQGFMKVNAGKRL